MAQTRLYMFNKNEEENENFVKHHYLWENTIIAKDYQLNIAENCLQKNTAVVLPTGLGKSIIAFLVMTNILPKKVLFLAPTKPLVMQHYESCKKFIKIDESDIAMFSGSISKEKRKGLFEKAKIVVSTPQTIDNDLKSGLYDINSFALVIFDEMHKAVTNYAYVSIAKDFKGLVLGLTASPGSKLKKIKQTLSNLKIENIESRTRSDPDVINHIHEINFEWIKVPMDEGLRKVQAPVYTLFLERYAKLAKLGILSYKKPEYISRKDILNARMAIKGRFGRTPYAFAIYIHHAVLLQSYHCLELIETQGSQSFLKYIDKFKEKGKLTKSEQQFIKSEHLQTAIALAKENKESSHPKLEVLKRVVENQFREEPDSLILIFAQYRDTIESIQKVLSDIKGAKIQRFIGQATKGKDKGMKQNEQKEIIEKFSKRQINILIATSVAEEGIDVPNVNRVIFYEPIPSEIRGIQRKGRTGRSHIGKVTILITEGTRDEAYLYAEENKEDKMEKIIEKMKNKKFSILPGKNNLSTPTR